LALEAELGESKRARIASSEEVAILKREAEPVDPGSFKAQLQAVERKLFEREKELMILVEQEAVNKRDSENDKAEVRKAHAHRAAAEAEASRAQVDLSLAQAEAVRLEEDLNASTELQERIAVEAGDMAAQTLAQKLAAAEEALRGKRRELDRAAQSEAEAIKKASEHEEAADKANARHESAEEEVLVLQGELEELTSKVADAPNVAALGINAPPVDFEEASRRALKAEAELERLENQVETGRDWLTERHNLDPEPEP